MDVIFHRNCLDGAYSAYLMYLLARSLTPDTYARFLAHLDNTHGPLLQPIRSQGMGTESSGSMDREDGGMVREGGGLREFGELSPDFFYEKGEVPFHCVSMHAGNMYPIIPSTPGNILVMVDISTNVPEQLALFADKFRYVIIFDHHTSFSKCRDLIQQQQLKNVFYIWDETLCATEIVYKYFLDSWGFPNNYPKLVGELGAQIGYVASNDLKRKETILSKQFVLGFYYFEIEMSHHNPNLFRRIHTLKLPDILGKGANQYELHMQCLIKSLQSAQKFTFKSGRLKQVSFLAVESSDRAVVSDLGCILSELSCRMGLSNLAIVYKKGAEYRVSWRSSQARPKPLALPAAESFGGGGHACAAGCAINKTGFGNAFRVEGNTKVQITKQEIESILFSTKPPH